MEETTGALRQLRRFISRQRSAKNRLRLLKKKTEMQAGGDGAIVYSRLPHDYSSLAFITDNVETCLGFSAGEWIVPGFWCEALHPEDALRVLSGAGRVAGKGTRVHEYRVRHKNGSWRLIRDESRVVRNGKSGPVQIIGIWTDITECRRAEQALRDAEKALLTAFSKSPAAGLLISLKKGHCIRANQSLKRITGYECGEVIRQSRSGLYRLVERQDLRRLIIAVNRGDKVRNVEVRFRTKHGGHGMGFVSVETLDLKGEPCALTVIDVGVERPPADPVAGKIGLRRLGQGTEMRASGEWSEAFESTIDPISILDADLTILKANRSFANAYGAGDPQQLVGKKCYSVSHGTTRPPANCPHVRAVATKEAVTAEFCGPGPKKHVLVSVSPIFSDSGLFRGCIHVSKDLAGLEGGGMASNEPNEDERDHSGRAIAGAPSGVTPRQKQVLRFLCEGLQTKEIAFRLGISARTVEFHKRSMMTNLGTRTVAELVRYAVTREGCL